MCDWAFTVILSLHGNIVNRTCGHLEFGVQVYCNNVLSAFCSFAFYSPDRIVFEITLRHQIGQS